MWGNIDGPNHSLEELQESLCKRSAHLQWGPAYCLGGGTGTLRHYLGINHGFMEKDEHWL